MPGGRESRAQRQRGRATLPPPFLTNFFKFFCSWLALTDPRDVARIESKTVIITQEQRDTVPIPKTGPSQLGRWMSEEDFEKAFNARFPGCMKGEGDSCLTGKNQTEAEGGCR